MSRRGARAQPLAATLLTGFPRSELARLVLARLLENDPEETVTCLVPARFQALAQEWLAALPLAQRERVSTLEGDVSALDMGLSGAEFNALAARVQTIHHCAAVTYSGAALAQAEAVNVGGTYEVVELARSAPGLQRLVHWSTVAAAGERQGARGERFGRARPVVYEDDLMEPHGSRLVHTRYRAERMIRKAQSELPITVIRPAMLVGDSRSGQLARLEGAHLLIAGLLTAPRELPVPRPLRGDALLQVVPIDYAVEAGLTLARAKDATGRTFHVVDPAPASLNEALTLIAELLGKPPPRGNLPGVFAQALLKLPLVDKLVHAQRALLEELGRDVVYDDSHARPVLARAGISCPPFSSYAGKLVAHVERQRKGDRTSFASLVAAAREHDDGRGAARSSDERGPAPAGDVRAAAHEHNDER
jgi:thioester reductase-like protein